ncbi:hypothetical protein E2C01_073196 [Portunus trituberculatus]|uniref:Uncharacterized protein n=1 Tax=Portunus trituberculatus TaxID=210409 RepID=A0A5B7I4J6_PORTR|nr:hypothetical protein [Portunus trituberculatus]
MFPGDGLTLIRGKKREQNFQDGLLNFLFHEFQSCLSPIHPSSSSAPLIPSPRLPKKYVGLLSLLPLSAASSPPTWPV